jgi:hypothetical protein
MKESNVCLGETALIRPRTIYERGLSRSSQPSTFSAAGEISVSDLEGMSVRNATIVAFFTKT